MNVISEAFHACVATMEHTCDWTQDSHQHASLHVDAIGPLTSFNPFVMKCPAAAGSQIKAILRAQTTLKKSMPLAKAAKAEQAYKLARRASESIAVIHNVFEMYAYKFFGDLGQIIHDTRMDTEQAAQSCDSVAPGSACGLNFACAADDLIPYDPHPYIHPMDSKLSCMPMMALIPTPATPLLDCSSGSRIAENSRRFEAVGRQDVEDRRPVSSLRRGTNAFNFLCAVEVIEKRRPPVLPVPKTYGQECGYPLPRSGGTRVMHNRSICEAPGMMPR